MTELHGFDRVEALAAEAEEHFAYSTPDKPSCLAFQQGFSAASLMAMQFAPINYVIPGYIAEGVTVFAGAPKIGKSWMVLGMAIAVASGVPAFGSIPCTQGDVLYLALEDNPRRLQSRLHKMGVTRAPDRLTFCTQWPSLDEGAVEHVEAWIASVQRPTMIVVDVLAKVRPAANGRDSQCPSSEHLAQLAA